MSSVHFTLVPYTRADGGKECPTSVVEGFVRGLPTLIFPVAPFTEFVAQNKGGVAFDPTPDGLVSALEFGILRYRRL
jgi:hypothetical protein